MVPDKILLLACDAVGTQYAFCIETSNGNSSVFMVNDNWIWLYKSTEAELLNDISCKEESEVEFLDCFR